MGGVGEGTSPISDCTSSITIFLPVEDEERGQDGDVCDHHVITNKQITEAGAEYAANEVGEALRVHRRRDENTPESCGRVRPA